MEKIKVSVIVPVYNVERVLKNCLESLVHQSYSEYEIIAVDDGSTDQSGEILDSYQKQYPHLIKVFHTENQRQAEARNYAIEKADGIYLAFCDADDSFEESALSNFVETAQKGDYDLVQAASYRIKGKNRFVLGLISQPVTKNKMLLELAPFTFWGIMVKRELILRAGKIPDMCYEDIAYIPPLISMAEKVGYCKKPLYRWIEREGSIVYEVTTEKMEDYLSAVKIAIQNTIPEFKSDVIMNLALKLTEKIKNVLPYGNRYLEELYGMKESIEANPYYIKEPRKYKVITDYLKLGGRPFIREILYVNGFCNDEMAKENLHEKMFGQGGQQIILNLGNCDVYADSIAKRLYEDKQMEQLGLYFGLMKIFETGGIYLAPGMRIQQFFDGIRIYEAFFGYQDESTFTDKVFGGKKGNLLIGRILDELRKAESSGMNFSECLEKVLKEDAEVEADGKTSYTKYKVALLSAQLLLVNLKGQMPNLSDYTFASNLEEMITMPRRTGRFLLNYQTGWQGRIISNQKFEIAEWKRKNKGSVEKFMTEKKGNAEKKIENQDLNRTLLKIKKEQKTLESSIAKLIKEKTELKKQNKTLNQMVTSDIYRTGKYLSQHKWGRAVMKLVRSKIKEIDSEEE